MSADPEDDAGGSEEAVRVFVRIRPLNKRELAAKQTIGWNFNDTSMLQDTQNGQRVYAFDRCFHPDGNNTEVYERVGKPVVLKALEGFNGTVFTYGQTGSGKTFTMRGNDEDPGMMILCIRDIFDYIASCTKRTFELRVSYMEVYNEEINDLLGSGPNSKNLRIVSEDAVKGAVIGGLTEELVANPAELMEVLARGESSRSYGSTEMNAESSRSHTIYRLAITSKEVDDGSEGGDIDAGGAMYVPSANGGAAAGRLSFMNLVDLAGSERQKSTGASGKTLKEGSNINKSLLSLGAVISKLGEASKKPAKGAKPVFIPYRDSKLTRILKQSLGGNTLTSILCTVTPAPMHIEETVSTLKFGQLCKTIKNNVKNNEVVDDRALIKMYKNLVAELRAQLVEAETTRGRTSSVLSGGGAEGDEPAEEGDGKATRELRSELSKSKKENEELKSTVHSLRQSVKEVQELEALKISLDDYQKESQAAIEEERAKMEEEKEALQKQRALMLAEKTQLNEKEGRLGTLLGMLDERESTLRQHLSALQEQQTHWQQSVDALRQREEQVEEWNLAHVERQKAIDEASAEVGRQREELETREIIVAETETQLENQKKELAEREAALAAQKIRLADVEIACTALQDKLSAEQAAVSGRVAYLDSKEKEYAEKLKEQETMDSLLKEREKEIETDRKTVDEKLEVARATEETHRVREAELDKKASAIRVKESEAVLMTERHARLLADLEIREAQCLKDANRQTENERMLNEQEARLFELQDQLAVKELTLAAVEEREKELQQRIEAHAKVEEDFYNVKVAMISARHSAELSELEGLVAEQLKISSNFQEEIEKMRADLKEALHEKAALESLNSARGLLIEKLQLEMAALNSDRRQLSSAEYQNSMSDMPNFGASMPAGGASAAALGQTTNSADVGENESDENRNRAQSGSGTESTSAQVFLNQLGATQRMLCKILDSHKQEKGRKERSGTSSKSSSRLKPKDEVAEPGREKKSSRKHASADKTPKESTTGDSAHSSAHHSKKLDGRSKQISEPIPEERGLSISSDASKQSDSDTEKNSPRFMSAEIAASKLSEKEAVVSVVGSTGEAADAASPRNNAPPPPPPPPRPAATGTSEKELSINTSESALKLSRHSQHTTVTAPAALGSPPAIPADPVPQRSPPFAPSVMPFTRSPEPSSSPLTAAHFEDQRVSSRGSAQPHPSRDYRGVDSHFGEANQQDASFYGQSPPARYDGASSREAKPRYDRASYSESSPSAVSPYSSAARFERKKPDSNYRLHESGAISESRAAGSSRTQTISSTRTSSRGVGVAAPGSGSKQTASFGSPGAVPVASVKLSLQRSQNRK